MNKQEFLTRLEESLAGLPQEELAGRLAFYSESIDDRVEEGLSEEAAVEELGPVDKIVSQILAEIPLPALVKGRMTPQRRMQLWEILLLVLGFPLWFPLLLAAFAVLLSVYVVIWSLIISLWAVELSCIVGALGSLASGLLSLFRGDVSPGLLMIGAGLILAGLSVFLFFGCRAVSKGALHMTGKIAIRVKSLFLRKEKA